MHERKEKTKKQGYDGKQSQHRNQVPAWKPDNQQQHQREYPFVTDMYCTPLEVYFTAN